MGTNGNICEEQENHPSAVDCCPQWRLIWLQSKRGYINNQCSKQLRCIIITDLPHSIPYIVLFTHKPPLPTNH